MVKIQNLINSLICLMLGRQLQLIEIKQDNNTKLKDLVLIEKLKKYLFRRMIYSKLPKVWKRNKCKH